MKSSARFGIRSVVKTFITWAAFVYFAVLFYIFFLARRRRGPTLPWSKRYFNLVPLKNKSDYYFQHTNIPGPARNEFYLDLFGNILLFIPLAFFICLIFRHHSPRKCILISFMISIGVELTQFLLSIGVADIDDVILNTTGALAGVAIFRILNKIELFKNLSVALGMHNKNTPNVHKK